MATLSQDRLPPPSQDRQPPLDVRGTASYIGCTERYVRRLVFERRIPFLKVGGTKVRFMPADLDTWLATQRVEVTR
jgi:excisionase family DNA binding protein